MRIALLPALDPARRRALARPLTETARAEMRSEAVQALLDAVHWLDLRAAQVRRGARILADLETLGEALWWLFDIALILWLLRVCLRRWDRWMHRAVELIGTALPVGPWTMLLARLCDFARDFGPPLLWLAAAAVVYRQLGGLDAPIEARVAYVLVFWIALFRAQMRLVDRLSRHLESRAHERAREATDIDAGEEGAIDAPRAEHHRPPSPRVPWPLVARAWRVLSGFVAVAVIVLALIALATGHGVLHGLVRGLALWGGVLLTCLCLHIWRAPIAETLGSRLATGSALARVITEHGRRWYGAGVVTAGLAVALARRLALLARDHVAHLESTKRLLAVLFRHRVEKHAAEHGRVLDSPPPLPAELLAEFPSGPVDPEDRPAKPGFLADIGEAFGAWQENRVQGSVVLVGAAGMGKTTALRLLESELEAPVLHAEVTTKYTRPGDLVAALGRLLGLSPPDQPADQPADDARDFPDEAALVAAIREQKRAVIALDGCHNFFLRHVGGFDAWHAFTRIVNQTCDRVFWVLACNDVAWQYLSNIAGGAAYFRRVIHIPPWSDEDLRRLILTRMRRAGYRVSFTDLLVTRIEGVETRAQIIRTSQGYFRLLWDFTGGNPRVAMHFWLRSLVPDPERQRVRVHLFAGPRIEELEALSDDIAFVLTAVLEHESLDAEALATVSNLPRELCRVALDYCCEHDYLRLDPRTGRFTQSVHWQRTILRYLRRRHFLYS